MSDSALSGIRVVDFTSGPAGGQCTTVLADFGAEVIKVEPPNGDRFRSMPASAFWLRGKQSVMLDLAEEEGRAHAQALAATADVVVVSGPPSRLRTWGLDASLRDELPHLVHCTISGWGTEGPYAELPGYEGIVAAKFGRMAAFEVQLNEGRPVYAAVQVATHVASQTAAQGILAALVQRQQSGHGAAVASSLMQGLMLFDLVDLLWQQVARQRGDQFTPLRKMIPMPTLNYHPVRTSDGVWIQCGNLLEHLFYSFLDAIELLGEFLIDEKFQGSPAEWTPETIEEARDRILTRVQQRTAAEWMQAFETNGNVAAEPIIDCADALQHLDLVDGRGLVQVTDPIVGATTQIAPIAELVATPATIARGAPGIGEHTDQVLAGLTPSAVSEQLASATEDEPSAIDGQPLQGITVLDLSTIIAAPLAVSMLADLGARVIKVEPLGGDPYRGLLTEGRMAVKTNAGKESIAVNLKTPAGQALLHELVVDADVLVHNFRGDVPNKLGIGYDQLSEINPELIWAVINGYGAHGPGAKRPATHPVMGACTGGVALQAGQALTRDCPTLEDLRETARQIMAANEANPDPNTSVVAATSIMLALVARPAAGGQMVRINMQVANAWANGDDFLAYEGKPARPAVDASHYGLHAGYRLYPTADGWVFLATTTDAEFVRFCDAAGVPELADDARYATAQLRLQNDEMLGAAVTAIFATNDAAGWEARLTAEKVACVRADGIEVGSFIATDPHMLANNWAPEVEHSRFGLVRRWGPAVTVNGMHDDYRSAPLAGEQTDSILAELGHDADAIAELRRAEVVSSE